MQAPAQGRYPTASAVVGDIIDIVKNPGRMQPAGWEVCAEKARRFSQFHARFYIRVPEGEKRRWSGSSARSRGFPRAQGISPA